MDWWITFDQQAADYLPDLRIEKEEPMDRHTSFRIGGPARRMAFPERGEQLVLLLDMAARCGARPLVMGNGTNLLAPDEGLDRLVIDTSAGLSRVEAGGTPGTILAEAGASLARVADFACRQAKSATRAREAPASARMVPGVPPASTRLRPAEVSITSRSSPSSGASRLVPLPITRGRAPQRAAMSSSSTSCSPRSGKAMRRAGPPMRKEVCRSMGSSFSIRRSGR